MFVSILCVCARVWVFVERIYKRFWNDDSSWRLFIRAIGNNVFILKTGVEYILYTIFNKYFKQNQKQIRILWSVKKHITYSIFGNYHTNFAFELEQKKIDDGVIFKNSFEIVTQRKWTVIVHRFNSSYMYHSRLVVCSPHSRLMFAFLFFFVSFFVSLFNN